MKNSKKLTSLLLTVCIVFGLAATASASTFTDAHGNVVELDDTLEAYTSVKLLGADDAARKGETNLGDLWTDALRWFAASGTINDYFEEDDVTAGNTSIAVKSDHIVALWNGGNLRADIDEGKFGAAELAKVLPYPNKVAVVYMTGAQLEEALEAAAQGLPYMKATAADCASFMQVSGLEYRVDAHKAYDKGAVHSGNWFKANSVQRVQVKTVNGKPFHKNDTYAVITSNANFNGMDSSYVFKAAAAANDKSAITTAVVRDVVWMYIQSELNNQVGTQYTAPQGRITVKSNNFSDVSADDWYADAVMYAASHGLMNGVETTTFAPRSTVTRGTVVTVLYRLAGSPAVEGAEDVWYGAAQKWAKEVGISDGSSMNGAITRQQFAAMLYRYAKFDAAAKGQEAPAFEETNILSYDDVFSLSDWAFEPMQWAVGAGIMQGSGSKLNPAATANRAEAATMLMRFCAK